MKIFKYGKTSVICFSLLASLFYNCIDHAGQSIASINGAVCNFNTLAEPLLQLSPMTIPITTMGLLK